MLKRCSKCKIEKDISEFFKRKKNKDGLRYQCKKCEQSDYLKYTQSDIGRNKILLRQHGITLNQYNKMSKQQKNKCLICGKKETSLDRYRHLKRLAVDHDHKTGKNRGLLCDRCNRALGYVYENKMILMKLINYIDIYK